jgi:hypothetical protein
MGGSIDRLPDANRGGGVRTGVGVPANRKPAGPKSPPARSRHRRCTCRARAQTEKPRACMRRGLSAPIGIRDANPGCALSHATLVLYRVFTWNATDDCLPPIKYAANATPPCFTL